MKLSGFPHPIFLRVQPGPLTHTDSCHPAHQPIVEPVSLTHPLNHSSLPPPPHIIIHISMSFLDPANFCLSQLHVPLHPSGEVAKRLVRQQLHRFESEPEGRPGSLYDRL